MKNSHNPTLLTENLKKKKPHFTLTYLLKLFDMRKNSTFIIFATLFINLCSL